jgi:hypothetical protein
MKFIPAPFSPERGEYVRTLQDADDPLSGSLVMALSDDGKRTEMRYTVITEDDEQQSVSSHLEACGLARWEIEDDLRTLTLRGDWVVRIGANRDEKVKALQEILRRHLNRPALRIQKKHVQREMVFARGRLALAPDVRANEDTVYITAGERRGETYWASGHLGALFGNLEKYVGRPVIDETESGGQQASFKVDASAIDAGKDPAKARKLLADLSRQTGLRLELERRPVTVYSLQGGGIVRK